MKLQFKNFKTCFFFCAMFIASLTMSSFAQDLSPQHSSYNSLTSVVDAMKLERQSCAQIGYYPQVGQAICANVTSAENFRNDWDLIVSNMGASFGLSALGDWKSEPARGVIHRTYLLGSTDLMVNYDVISSRITIDVLDPELQAQEEARRVAQAKVDAARAQYDAAQAAHASQTTQTGQAIQTTQQTSYDQTIAQAQTVPQTINGYDVSAAYPTQQAQTATTNGYVATNADGTAFVLAETHTATDTTMQTATQAVTQQAITQPVTTTAAATTDTSTTVTSRAYASTAPAQATVQAVQQVQTTAQVVVQPTLNTGVDTGYSTTANNYIQNTAQTATYQAVAQTQGQTGATQTSQAYAYTPTNLITAMGTTAQNTAAFQPNGAWQITSSGSAATIDLYDTATQSFVRTVYPDQVYTDVGSYYLSIAGNAAWALSVWTE